MAPEKTEALLVTDRRPFQYPRIVLGEHENKWKPSIKYLGVQLDRRLSFGLAYAQHWWNQGSEKETGDERGAFKAALRSFGLGSCPTEPCYPAETVLNAERCCAENSFSL